MGEIKTNIRKRTAVTAKIVAFAMLVLILRLANWQFVRGSEMQTSAIEQQTMDSVVTSKRGIIYDRNGKVLAQSVSVQTVTASPAEVKKSKKAAKTAKKLAELLNMDADEIEKKITRNSMYEIVARKIDNSTAEKIRKAGLKGIYLIEDSKRTYPYGSQIGRAHV